MAVKATCGQDTDRIGHATQVRLPAVDETDVPVNSFFPAGALGSTLDLRGTNLGPPPPTPLKSLNVALVSVPLGECREQAPGPELKLFYSHLEHFAYS